MTLPLEKRMLVTYTSVYQNLFGIATLGWTTLAEVQSAISALPTPSPYYNSSMFLLDATTGVPYEASPYKAPQITPLNETSSFSETLVLIETLSAEQLPMALAKLSALSPEPSVAKALIRDRLEHPELYT